MKYFTPFTVIALLAFTIVSCNKKVEETKEIVVEPAFNLTTAKAEIVVANKKFMTLFAASDSVGLTNLYTQDSKFMMSGAPAISGKENIQATFHAIMSSGVNRVDLRTIDVWGTEDLITEEGGLSLFVGDDEVDQGKYVVLWKKENGEWKLFRDIFNSNLSSK